MLTFAGVPPKRFAALLPQRDGIVELRREKRLLGMIRELLAMAGIEVAADTVRRLYREVIEEPRTGAKRSAKRERSAAPAPPSPPTATPPASPITAAAAPPSAAEPPRTRGCHLLVEQPNKSFLARHRRDTSGNLYKLICYGNGVVGKHEKKTNLTGGHDDLLAVIDGLNKTRGAEQWAFIQKHFNLEEFINYFAVNMCIQNWDGFHNNYFLYHDTGGTARWEIYPWDEDKTWGDYDRGPPKFEWYDLPLTYGMNGSVRPEAFGGPAATRGPFAGWWREPGFLSGPMLANQQFRQRFLVRLREVCKTIFTEEKMLPLINALEKRLETEVPLRAQLDRRDAAQAMAQLRAHIQSFRDQVVHRRKFILAELDKARQ